MCNSRFVLGLGAGLGLVSIGSGVMEASVPLTVAGAGFCLALRRRLATGVAAALLAMALASVQLSEGSRRPDPDRVADVVVRAESLWRQGDRGMFLMGRAELVRQAGRVRHWDRPVLVEVSEEVARDGLPSGARYRVRGHVRRPPPLSNFGVTPRPRSFRIDVRHEALIELAPSSSWREAWWSASRALRARVEGGLVGAGEAEAGLFRALVLGDSRSLPERWRPAFERTGIAHVLAVSGLHVGMLLVLVLRLCGRLGGWGRALCGAGALLLYLLLVGPRPSLVRAAIMGMAALLSLAVERPRSVGAALSWAALAILAVDPEVVLELGFQLTVSATASILCASRQLEKLEPRPGPLARSAVVSLAAQIGTMPFLLPRVGLTNAWAPLLNLVAIPWAAASLSASWLWLVLGLEATPFGRVAADLVLACALLPAALARAPASFLAGSLGLAGWCWGAWAPVAALALGRVITLPGVATRIGLGSMIAIGLLFAATGGGGVEATHPELVVLDVGQGDAIVLRDGEAAFLVDGGGWRRGDIASGILVPALAGLGVSGLDGIAPTHSDRDHCRGLLQLQRRIAVERVYLPAGAWAGECTRELGLAPGRPARWLWAGARFRVGRWRVRVLRPSPGTGSTTNRDSLALLAEVEGRRFVLTGDIDGTAERAIVDRLPGGGWSIDLLKVAHHGSKTSTSEAWLDALPPRLAIATVGAGNPYGHPSEVVVERLRERGIRLLRTDRTGAIRVTVPPGAPVRIETAVGSAGLD